MSHATTTLNVREFINARALSPNQWVLVLLCFFIVAVDGMDVAIMGFVAPSIIAEWGISRPAFGAVMGAAPIGLAIGALVAGSSSDWWGRRKVLLGSVLFSWYVASFEDYNKTYGALGAVIALLMWMLSASLLQS